MKIALQKRRSANKNYDSMQQKKKEQFSSKPVNNTMHMVVLLYNVMNIDKQVRLTAIDLVAQQAKAKRGARAFFA